MRGKRLRTSCHGVYHIYTVYTCYLCCPTFQVHSLSGTFRHIPPKGMPGNKGSCWQTETKMLKCANHQQMGGGWLWSDPRERVCGDECESEGLASLGTCLGQGQAKPPWERGSRGNQEEACSAAEIEVRLKDSFCKDCKRETSKKCQRYKANGYT